MLLELFIGGIVIDVSDEESATRNLDRLLGSVVSTLLLPLSLLPRSGFPRRLLLFSARENADDFLKEGWLLLWLARSVSTSSIAPIPGAIAVAAAIAVSATASALIAASISISVSIAIAAAAIAIGAAPLIA